MRLKLQDSGRLGFTLEARKRPLVLTPISPPPPLQKSEARAERYRLQGHAQCVLWNEGVKAGLKYPANFHKTIKCLRVRVGDQVDIHRSREHGTAFYGGGLVVCGKPGCTTCSSKIQERRRGEIAQAFDWAYGTGKKVVMVTLTFSHSHDQALADLLAKQAECLKKLRKGKAWDKMKARTGYTGMIRSLEITHGVNGWHPHTHEAWIVDRDTDVNKLTETITERWLRICQSEGLCPEGKEAAFREHSVDVVDECRASDYLAKTDDTGAWGADRELAKSSTKKGRKAGRSVFQLLSDGADGCEKSDRLYVEFVEAIKGRPIIRWSQGLKALVGVDDLTDEQLAAAQEDKADLLALLSPEDWRCVLAHDARAHILELAELGGLKAVREWLEAPELPIINITEKKKSEKEVGDPPPEDGGPCFTCAYDLDIANTGSQVKSQGREYRLGYP